MFSFFIGLSLSLGFEVVSLPAGGSHQLNISNIDFFFRIYSPKEKISPAILQVYSSESNMSEFKPSPNQYFKVEGKQLIFKSNYDKNLSIIILKLHFGTCSNLSFALDFGNYIEFSQLNSNYSENLCIFSYYPKLNYRILMNCISQNRDSICYVASQSILKKDDPFTSCIPNNTCDDAVDNGFLISIKNYDNSSSILDMFTTVIKGSTKNTDCNVRYVPIFTPYGMSSFYPENYTYPSSCQPKKEPLYIGVILIFSIIIIILTALILFKTLRPNKQAYDPIEREVESQEHFLPIREERDRTHLISASEVALAH